MPPGKTPEAAERDRARKRRRRAEQSAEDLARINEQRRERYAQKRALQTPAIREQNKTRRREQYAHESAQQPPEQREQTNARRREQYAHESAQQAPEQREQTNARRRDLRNDMNAEEHERVNTLRRDQYAQGSAQQPAEERAQNNHGRRETYAERRARNLGKTRNNFIREPEASLDDIKLHSVGELCLTCRKCDARLFKGERTAPGNTFSFCCAQGQVQIPRIPRPPWPLDDYLTEQTPAAKHFRGNTRQFNNALSMASTGAKVSDRIASGVQSFTVCGKVHHRMGPLLPEQDARPAFAQLYILDPDAANSRRLEIFPELSREVLDKLDQMLRQHNGFVSIFERAVQTSNQENKPELKLVLNADMTTVPDPRRYNVPASNGLAAFIPDGMLPEVNCRQIALNV